MLYIKHLREWKAMSIFLRHFTNVDRNLFVTEFGHSAYTESKRVGPWSRGIYILHFVSKGYCEFSGFRAKAGQAFLIAKEHLHSFTTSEDYEHYWIGILGDSLEKIFDGFKIGYKSHQLFFVENADFVRSLFATASDQLQSGEPEFVDSYVLSVFTAVLPLLKSVDQSSMHRKINYAEKVRIFIESNYSYPIKMTDIAKEMHLSEKHMCRLFVKRYGISPQKFLAKTRMEAAKELLLGKQLSVKEVAYIVGYASLPTFSKKYSEYFGISPSKVKTQENKTLTAQ